MRRKKRKKSPVQRLANVTVDQILAWADQWHASCGRWPKRHEGRVPNSLGLTWRKLDNSLRYGFRGLPGRSSLAKLLAEERGVRNVQRLPSLSLEKVLAWADEHHAGTGQWPTEDTGPVTAAPGEIWLNICASLREGTCGLPGGQTLARLLKEHRGVRNVKQLPRLTRRQILSWAEAYFTRQGRWPNARSGPIEGAPGETWAGVVTALQKSTRGLRGSPSLAQLLAQHRGVRNRMRLPRLTEKLILKWADLHFRRTGKWPGGQSGPVRDAPGETWRAIEAALDQGHRSLSGGTSLARLLQRYKNIPPNST